MIEIILRVGIILTALVFIQAFFNSYLYRQVNNPIKYGIFSVVTLLILLVTIISIFGINSLTQVPFLGKVITGINSPFHTFYGYLPKPILIIWFIIPALLAWVIFVFKGGLLYQQIKKSYSQVVKQEVKEKDVVKKVEPKSKKEEKSSVSLTNASLQKPESKVKKIKPKKIIKVVKPISLKPVPKLYFLEEVKTHPFNPRTLAGLQAAVRLAKKDFLLGKTAKGYVAIYENRTGLMNLKKLFSKNGIDISTLKTRPSIVFFTQEKVQAIGLKEYITKLKVGDK